MRQKKYLLVLLDVLMLLGCIGIVWLIGYLADPQDRRKSMPPDTAIEPGAGGGRATPSDAGLPDGLKPDEMDQSHETGYGYETIPGQAEAEERERQRQAWLDAERNRRIRQQRRCAGETNAAEGPAEPEEEPYVPPTIMLASDLHFMSKTTHDGGSAFWKMTSGDDGKVNQYSEEMTDALLETAIRNRPAALVLSGDITLNGERENHEQLARKLRRVQEAGVPVVVIPGNHDINNRNAATYFGDKREKAEYLETGEDFLEIYHEFGYDQSPNRDPNSLSYVYPVDASHWLLMLDTCQYENGSHVNGRLKQETLDWLKVHLEVAEENQIQVLPVAHHNLLSESRLYTTDCTLENHGQVVELLEQFETPLYISGHLHAQRIKKHKAEPGAPEDTYGITEIVLSPYSIAPNQYGELYWNTPEDMAFTTRQVDVAAFAAEDGSENMELLRFGEYAAEYLKQVIKAQVMEKITLVPDDLKERMARLYAELYYDYCAGNRTSWDEVEATAGYRLWQRVDPDGRYTAEIGQMIEDTREDLYEWKTHKTGE